MPYCSISIIHPNIFLMRKTARFTPRRDWREFGRQIKEGGAFALWSNDPVDDEFTAHLESVFGTAAAHNIEFPNPYTNSTF